jgi:hypothetical protein
VPEQVLPLVVHAGTGMEGAKFYNGGYSDATFSWRFDENGWQEVTLAAGKTVEVSFQGVTA